MTDAPSTSNAPAWRSKALILIALLAALLFLLPNTAGLPLLRLVAKPVPVLAMALWLAWQPGRARYQTAVIAGLLLGALGDFLLELGDNAFIFGLAAFLLGHLAYVAAFLSDCRQARPALALASFGYGILAFLVLYRAGNLGGLMIPVALYVLVISAMLWRGLSRLGMAGVARRSALLGAAGAILFTLSDSVLAYGMFVERFPWSGLLIMSTYWLGQLGIALSAKDQADQASA